MTTRTTRFDEVDGTLFTLGKKNTWVFTSNVSHPLFLIFDFEQHATLETAHVFFFFFFSNKHIRREGDSLPTGKIYAAYSLYCEISVIHGRSAEGVAPTAAADDHGRDDNSRHHAELDQLLVPRRRTPLTIVIGGLTGMAQL